MLAYIFILVFIKHFKIFPQRLRYICEYCKIVEYLYFIRVVILGALSWGIITQSVCIFCLVMYSIKQTYQIFFLNAVFSYMWGLANMLVEESFFDNIFY